MFAIGFLFKKPINQRLVGFGRFVGKERFDFLKSRRQTGQVQSDSAYQRRPVGFFVRRKFLTIKPRKNECVNRIPLPALIGRWRKFGANRHFVGPVFSVTGSLFNPLCQRFDFFLGQRGTLAGWRHDHIGIGARNAFEQLAGFRLARNNRGVLAKAGRRSIMIVEAQISLPLGIVRTVTSETSVRKDASDVAVEVDLLRRRCRLIVLSEHRFSMHVQQQNGECGTECSNESSIVERGSSRHGFRSVGSKRRMASF